MVHTGIFCTKAEIDVKVGKLVDSGGYTEANINNSCAQAESMINSLSHVNWSDAYATLNADTKRILSEAAACWVAIDFITYNPATYTTRYEAEDLVNVNWTKFQILMSILSDSSDVDFVKGA